MGAVLIARAFAAPRSNFGSVHDRDRFIAAQPATSAPTRSVELAAANAHDGHHDFIMKLRMTFRLQLAVRAPDHYDLVIQGSR